MKLDKALFAELVKQAEKDTAIVSKEDGTLANAYPYGWLGRLRDETLDGPNAESAGLLSSFIKNNIPMIAVIVEGSLKAGTINEDQAANLTLEFVAMIAYKVCKTAYDRDTGKQNAGMES